MLFAKRGTPVELSLTTLPGQLPNWSQFPARLANVDLIRTGAARDRDTFSAPNTKVVKSWDVSTNTGTFTLQFDLGRVGDAGFYVRLRGSDGKRLGPGLNGAAVDPAGPVMDVVGSADPWDGIPATPTRLLVRLGRATGLGWLRRRRAGGGRRQPCPRPHAGCGRGMGPASLVAAAQQAASAAAERHDGRAVLFAGRSTLVETMTVARILEQSEIDEVVQLAHGFVDPDARVDTRDFVRPVLREGRLELLVQPIAGELLAPFEVPNPTPCCADH